MNAAQQAARYTATHNEGGQGYNPHAEAITTEAHARAEARLQHVIDNIDAFKAAWGAAVDKHTKGGQIRALDLPQIEAEAGVTHREIQAVKARLAGM